jgi:hypothetical protein
MVDISFRASASQSRLSRINHNENFEGYCNRSVEDISNANAYLRFAARGAKQIILLKYMEQLSSGNKEDEGEIATRQGLEALRSKPSEISTAGRTKESASAWVDMIMFY